MPLETMLNRLNLEPTWKRVYCPQDHEEAEVYFGCTPEALSRMTAEEKESHSQLELCPGHKQPQDEIVLPFDGWALAAYVRKWHGQQPGQAPLFEQ